MKAIPLKQDIQLISSKHAKGGERKGLSLGVTSAHVLKIVPSL